MYTKFIQNKYHLGSDSLFVDLSIDEKILLESQMVSHEYKKGQVIFRGGMTPNGIYLLHNGRAKKYTIGDDGKQHIFYICSSGEALGYHSLLSEEPYPDYAETLEDSTISFIPKSVFFTLLDQSKQLSQKLLKSLSHEFTVFIHSTTVFAQKTVRERLALSLLMLKDKYTDKDSQDKPVEITLLREDLANIVGTATETLVRLLRDLKEEHIIETEGRIIRVLHPAKLARIANFC